MNSVPRWAHRAAVVLLLLYAGVAACRTLDAFDLGWQLASGRYISQTHSVPWQDVFSYTAAGREWIYPVGAPLIFYSLFNLGGYVALNWLGIAVAMATIAALILVSGREAGPAGLLLIALAVPSIAGRSVVRADMFTTLLFAWSLALLIQRRLYVIPFLFLAWANLHQGFIFGLALFAIFTIGALAGRDWVYARRLLLFGALSAAAVLINPYGWRLYRSLLTVARDMEFQKGLIAEASAVPIGLWRIEEFRRLYDPASAFWVLVLLGIAAVVAAVFRRRVVPFVLAAFALYLAERYARAQALAAILIVASVPAVFVLPARFAGLRRALAGGATALLVTFIAFHGHAFASSRYYIADGEIANFGFGPSWWFPERAFDFMVRERLPARIYNDYNLGGWAVWRLAPGYAVYIDGRAAPFTPDVLLEQQRILALSPESPEWQQWLDARQINTIVISLARNGGYRISPALLCVSAQFRLVYMDEVSGVWLRNLPANSEWLQRLSRPCPAEPFAVPAGKKADQYNFLANAGQLYQALGNDALALESYAEAERLFSEDAGLRLSVSAIWKRNGRTDEARRELLDSLRQRPSAQAWHWLGMLEYEQGRFEVAADAFLQAARRAVLPHESYRMLGEAMLALHRPQDALKAFDRAERSSRYRDPQNPAAIAFIAALANARSRARAMASAP